MKRRGQCSVKIKEGQRTRRKEEVILVIVVYRMWYDHFANFMCRGVRYCVLLALDRSRSID